MGLVKNIILAALIGIIASIIDQTVHIINPGGTWTHQIYLIFAGGSLATDTMWYVLSKFGIVFFAALIGLSFYVPESILSISIFSLIISVISGVIFGMLLTYVSPYTYTIGKHIFHAFAYGIASFAVLFANYKIDGE
jgi:hypothetical protein